MAESCFVLDTNAVIFLTTKGKTISFDLQNNLNEADLFISGITEIELFSKQSMPLDEEEKLRVFISERLLVIGLTGEIKKETIALRRSTKLKLPDCIIAATSIVFDALLLTDDRDLLNLSWPGYKVKGII